MKNGVIILCLLVILSILYTVLVPIHRTAQASIGRVSPQHAWNQSNNSTGSTASTVHTPQQMLSNQEVANGLLWIYEQQTWRLTTAPFLPMYENHRLKLKLNVTSIATHLYGSLGDIEVSDRQLRIVCSATTENDPAFQVTITINVNFATKSVRGNQIHLTFKPGTSAMYSSTASTVATHIEIDWTDTISIELQPSFSIDLRLRFTYQWTDSNVTTSLDWPQWPLPKPCVDSISQNIARNQPHDSQLNASCLTTSVLTYSSAKQLFATERSAIIHWLDTQYDALRSESPVGKKPRRLSPIEASLNPSVCSSEFNDWISAYQQWHQNVTSSISHRTMTFEQQRDRILDLNVRFLLYENPGTGVADRIVHMMTTYLVAVLTNRLFLFGSNWPDFLNTMRSSLNYEQRDIIPWVSRLQTLNGNVSANDSKYLTSRLSSFSTNNFNQDYDYDREFPERILTFHGEAGNIVHLMNSNTSIYHKFLMADLRMSPETMFGCLFHSLLVHRLAALIERTSRTANTASLKSTFGHSAQQILQLLLSPMFFPIGIQVRTGDARMQYNASDGASMGATDAAFTAAFEKYFLCAQDVATEHQESLNRDGQMPISFLLTDTSSLRRGSLRRWQLPSYCLHGRSKECYNSSHPLFVLANSDPVFHIARTSQPTLAFQVAMFDIFLFSLCERHIISTHSGFGRVAVFASLKQHNIHSLTVFDSFSCRDRNQETSLIDSAYDWSGIWLGANVLILQAHVWSIRGTTHQHPY